MGDVTHTHLIIEPSAGSGRFVKTLRAQWPGSTIIAVEIRAEEQQNLHTAGANHVYAGTDWSWWVSQTGFQGPVLQVGNPPFSLAQEHIEASFKYLPTKSTIAFLLRLSFFGGKARNFEFWKQAGLKFLKYIIPIAPRPSFKKGKSDNSEYGLFIWEKDNTAPTTVLDSIMWSKKRPTRVKK